MVSFVFSCACAGAPAPSAKATANPAVKNFIVMDVLLLLWVSLSDGLAADRK
jgi:hypothetical protein